MEENNDILGIKGIPSENLHAGVGYVIIPEGEDIEKYKEDVYRSGKVSIYGGYGYSNFYNIHVDREVLQRIKFPKEVGKYGSPVVWVNIPKHNEPIVIATIKEEETLHMLSEFRKRITRSYNGALVDLDLDAKRGKISISAIGNKDKAAEIQINIGSIEDDGILKLDVNGEILIRSSNRIVAVTESKIETAVTDKSGIVKALVRLSSKEEDDQLTYQDEWDNKIIANEENIQIVSEKIKHNNGNEPMVLGNKLEELLKELISEIQKITVTTPNGPSGTPINNPNFTKISNKLEDFKSLISNLD